MSHYLKLIFWTKIQLKNETFGSIFTVKIRQMNQNSDPKKPPKVPKILKIRPKYLII